MSHTPGPWNPYNAKNGKLLKQWHVSARSWDICTLSREWPSDETIANAALIAAAPDLLAACKSALAVAEHEIDIDTRAGKRLSWRHHANLLRAAIAKAAGKENSPVD